MNKVADIWNSGDPYEYFMGRWSSLMAPVFLDWLGFPLHKSWLDLGCGTGALSESIYLNCKPLNLTCIDPSEQFLKKARERLHNNADLIIGNALNLPIENNFFDIIVSGLALNFFPDLDNAFLEMKRVSKPGGTIAAYVWDYSDRMDLLRYFWDAALDIDPGAQKFDEGFRFPICNIDKLRNAFQGAGLSEVETAYLNIETVFKNFEDYWNPFLGGQGPAPGYLASLSENVGANLRDHLQKKLNTEPDGSIKLMARAIAVRGRSV